MKVKLLDWIIWEHSAWPPGSELELPKHEAEKLIAVGESKPDASLDKPVLAAYTMVANELMNLDEVLNK